MLNCEIIVPGRRSRGMSEHRSRGYTHVPVLDRVGRIGDLAKLHYTGFRSPVLRHVTTCTSCDPNDLIRAIGVGYHDARTMRALWGHPGVDRSTWLRKAAQMRYMMEFAIRNDFSMQDIVDMSGTPYLTVRKNYKDRPGSYKDDVPLHEALEMGYFPKAKNREWLIAFSRVRHAGLAVTHPDQVMVLIPIVDVHTQ
jgi:hypothetical protein